MGWVIVGCIGVARGHGGGRPPIMKKLVFEKHSNLQQNRYSGW